MRAASLLLLIACGCGDSTAAADAGPPDGPVELVGVDWTIPPGGDVYLCASVTVERELAIGSFVPVAPLGTHHTGLSFGDPQGPDDPGSPCSSGDEAHTRIFASGIDTPELVLPAGVGVVIPAGKQVHLNLHLFNTGDAPLSGHSGVAVRLLASVTTPADVMVAGPLGFTVPPGQSSVSDDCTVPTATRLIAVFPHMHRLGTHMKAERVRGAQVDTIIDEPYDFEAQAFHLIAPLDLAPGDVVRTTCSWDNSTQATVPFGTSSEQEMCFSIWMRTPAGGVGGGQSVCSDGLQ